MAGRKILLVGDNFGAGSSREHAPWALAAWGVRAILSTSYADIFRSNSLKNGVLPIVVDRATHGRLFDLVAREPDAELTVDLAEQGILLPDGTTIDFDIDPFAKRMILAGTDELGYLLSKAAELEAWEAHTRRGSIRAPERADRPTGAADRSAEARRRPADVDRLEGRTANAHRAADERRRQVIAVGLDGGAGQAERADRRVGGRTSHRAYLRIRCGMRNGRREVGARLTLRPRPWPAHRQMARPAIDGCPPVRARARSGGLCDDPAVNLLDAIAVCLIVAGAILGWRSGAIPQIAGLVGAIVGGVAVILALPYLADPLSGLDPTIRPITVLVLLIAAVAIGESIGASLGRAVAGRLGDGLLGAADRTAGSALAVAQALLVVWLAGSLLAEGPVPRLAETAGTSTAVRTMATDPAATDRGRGRARRLARRHGPARRVRRLRAAAGARGRAAERPDGAGDRRGRRSQHVQGLGRDLRRLVGRHGLRRSRRATS